MIDSKQCGLSAIPSPVYYSYSQYYTPNILFMFMYSIICLWTTLSMTFDSSHKFAIGRVSDGEEGGFTLRRGRTKARFQDGGKWPSLRQALNRSASKGANLGRALLMEKRETQSGPAEREGEVEERMFWETCSEETLENMKIGREGKGKSRAVARSAAKQAEEAQETEKKKWI